MKFVFIYTTAQAKAFVDTPLAAAIHPHKSTYGV